MKATDITWGSFAEHSQGAQLLGFSLFVMRQDYMPQADQRPYWAVSRDCVALADGRAEHGPPEDDLFHARDACIAALPRLLLMEPAIAELVAERDERLEKLQAELTKARQGCKRLRMRLETIAASRAGTLRLAQSPPKIPASLPVEHEPDSEAKSTEVADQ